jgi:hypothetical protein
VAALVFAVTTPVAYAMQRVWEARAATEASIIHLFAIPYFSRGMIAAVVGIGAGAGVCALLSSGRDRTRAARTVARIAMVVLPLSYIACWAFP